jgi:molecular chaperone GrpE
MNGDEQDYVPEGPSNGLGEDISGDDITALKAEAADLKDRLLRSLADAENTRRRAEREKADASQYAVTSFARDMLSVADNLKRALDAYPPEARAGAPAQVKAVIEGIEATERHLQSTLERHGVKMIDICIRRSRKCRRRASRPARSSMWFRRAMSSPTGFSGPPW